MMTAEQRVNLIRNRLTEAFAPTSLDIVDDSQKHVGHASAQGGGHFNVRIVSTHFAGKKPLERHRMVFATLSDALQAEIHALSIQAKTPEEA